MDTFFDRTTLFVKSRKDEDTEKTYGISINKIPLFENENPEYLENSLNRLFNYLYSDGYLTNKPTVFVGVPHGKLSIDVYLDK